MSRKKFFCTKSHRKIGKTVESQLETRNRPRILRDKPFVEALVNICIIKNLPDFHLYYKHLFSSKYRYDVKITTYALNELLGRPVPNVINVDMMEEPTAQKLARLDKILGFVDNEGKEIEIIRLEQQLKMNDIMVDILKKRGLDFEAAIAEAANLKNFESKWMQCLNESK